MGFIDLYFCMCCLRRMNPNYQPPFEANHKTLSIVLPKDEEEFRSWVASTD